MLSTTTEVAEKLKFQELNTGATVKALAMKTMHITNEGDNQSVSRYDKNAKTTQISMNTMRKIMRINPLKQKSY